MKDWHKGAWLALPRSERRKSSRDLARRFARYNGPEPRYEPARAALECGPHHRKLPCSRCLEA